MAVLGKERRIQYFICIGRVASSRTAVNSSIKFISSTLITLLCYSALPNWYQSNFLGLMEVRKVDQLEEKLQGQFDAFKASLDDRLEQREATLTAALDEHWGRPWTTVRETWRH